MERPPREPLKVQRVQRANLLLLLPEPLQVAVVVADQPLQAEREETLLILQVVVGLHRVHLRVAAEAKSLPILQAQVVAAKLMAEKDFTMPRTFQNRKTRHLTSFRATPMQRRNSASFRECVRTDTIRRL